MIQQFRNIEGYLIPARLKPRYIENSSKYFNAIAKLVYCPERDGLVAIGNCKLCENFNGIKRYQGVKCKTQCTRKAPYYYNKKSAKYEHND